MRGVTSETTDSVINSWLCPDMESMLEQLDLGATNSVAVDIFRSLNEKSDVVVYGDYDVDGITATVLAVEMVMQRKARVKYFIPHRFNQGYGLHSDVAMSIVKRKCDLVVVVDCGTQDVEAVRLIRESGIPIVILDHHLAEGELAKSDTMVNPQIGGDITAKRLCAAGVVWCWAWQNELLSRDMLRQLLDLVALATVADCVSLASPLNRVLVQEGLDVLRRATRPGLAILMDKLGLNPSAIDSEDLAMKIIPCLNAAGRLYLADLAVKILFDADDLPEKVDQIIGLNKKRRELSSKILEQVDGEGDAPYQYVLTDENWSVGVLSSVASRICNERNAPVALVASVGEIMRGTMRMPAGGDAVGILKTLAPKLNTWGGHRLAAGFSVKIDKWQEVRDELEKILSNVKVLSDKEDLLYWSPSELDLKAWHEAEKLGPFGMDNPCPKLYSPYNGNVKISPLGKNGKHVKIDLGESTLLGFGAAEIIKDRESLMGWVYRPRVDTWRNITSLQLVLEKMVTV
jgi:single-stranded-DNA-specific exonuclease